MSNIDDKLQSIDNKLASIDTRLGVYNAQLELHIKRTDQNESAILELERNVASALGASALAKWLVTTFLALVAAVAAVWRALSG